MKKVEGKLADDYSNAQLFYDRETGKISAGAPVTICLLYTSSPYRHLELCGIALTRKIRTPSAENQHLARLFDIFFVNTLDRAWFIRYYYKCVS